MSRNTVERLLGLAEPPRYLRRPKSSQLDPFTERIAAMLAAEPTVRATAIRERLQPLGYRGGITILKDHVARVRPMFLASRAFQRTSYRRARSARSTGGTPVSGCPSGAASAARPSVW